MHYLSSKKRVVQKKTLYCRTWHVFPAFWFLIHQSKIWIVLIPTIFGQFFEDPTIWMFFLSSYTICDKTFQFSREKRTSLYAWISPAQTNWETKLHTSVKWLWSFETSSTKLARFVTKQCTRRKLSHIWK